MVLQTPNSSVSHSETAQEPKKSLRTTKRPTTDRIQTRLRRYHHRQLRYSIPPIISISALWLVKDAVFSPEKLPFSSGMGGVEMCRDREEVYVDGKGKGKALPNGLLYDEEVLVARSTLFPTLSALIAPP